MNECTKCRDHGKTETHADHSGADAHRRANQGPRTQGEESSRDDER